MKPVIEIGISIEEITVRHQRVETARRFGTPDRVPVLPAVAHLPRPKDFAWTDDLAVSLSPDMFREIVLPANQRLRDHFDGRLSLHMCGKSDHLLDIFRDDLRIHELQGFGWEVNLDRIAAAMSGRVVLLGNIDPRLILHGTPADVIEATRRVIEKLGPGRGLLIQDGNNIPPGSPLPNINAMMDAAERFGRYD